MFPNPHEIHHVALQKQRELLAEAEHMRLVRLATAHTMRVRSGDRRRVRLSAVRAFVAAALYTLARWIDARDASPHPVAYPSPRLTT